MAADASVPVDRRAFGVCGSCHWANFDRAPTTPSCDFPDAELPAAYLVLLLPPLRFGQASFKACPKFRPTAPRPF